MQVWMGEASKMRDKSLWELDDYNRWNSFFQKPEKTNVEETEDEL